MFLLDNNLIFVLISGEYYSLIGERIPLKDLGCSLESLLISTGKFSIFNDKGIKTVIAKTTSKTQHLTDLIKKQKTKPPKKKSVSFKMYFFYYKNVITIKTLLGS